MAAPVSNGGELELHVDSLAFGGNGVARHDGFVIFVRRGLPGDTVRARITDSVRPGVVSAPSVWWKKLTADRRNANELTSQAIADMGGAATYYDCLVEVRPAD